MNNEYNRNECREDMKMEDGHESSLPECFNKYGIVSKTLARDCSGFMPSLKRQIIGHGDIINVLTINNYRADSDMMNKIHRMHETCYNCFVGIIEMLVSNLRNVNNKDEHGKTALHYSSHHGFLEVAKILISRNCNANLIDSNECTALHYASLHGHANIVNILILANCNLNDMDISGKTALHYACIHKHVDIVKLFIDTKCNLDNTDLTDRTPLHCACNSGRLDIASLLIARNCALNEQDWGGHTAIYIACNKNHVDIVKLLISKNCNIQLKNKAGISPLKIACICGHKDVVNVLLSQDCILDTKNIFSINNNDSHRNAFHDIIDCFPFNFVSGENEEITFKNTGDKSKNSYSYSITINSENFYKLKKYVKLALLSNYNEPDHLKMNNREYFQRFLDKQLVSKFPNKKHVQTKYKICCLCFTDKINRSLRCGHVFCDACSVNVAHCPTCRNKENLSVRIIQN